VTLCCVGVVFISLIRELGLRGEVLGQELVSEKGGFKPRWVWLQNPFVLKIEPSQKQGQFFLLPNIPIYKVPFGRKIINVQL